MNWQENAEEKLKDFAHPWKNFLWALYNSAVLRAFVLCAQWRVKADIRRDARHILRFWCRRRWAAVQTTHPGRRRRWPPCWPRLMCRTLLDRRLQPTAHPQNLTKRKNSFRINVNHYFTVARSIMTYLLTYLLNKYLVILAKDAYVSVSEFLSKSITVLIWRGQAKEKAQNETKKGKNSIRIKARTQLTCKVTQR